MRARFVICANGTLSKPKLAQHRRHGDVRGPLVPHVALGLRLHRRATSSTSHDKVVGIIGTGASAVQVVPNLGGDGQGALRLPAHAVVDRHQATTGRPTPSGRRSCKPGWQAKRRAKAMTGAAAHRDADRASARRCRREEKIRRQENANIDYMMRIHRRIDEIVEDPATAEALKPWYMFMCKRPCFHNEYLPTFNRPNVHLVDTHGEGITEIGREGPGLRRPRVRARPADLRHRLRGAEDRHLQPDRRRGRRRAQRQVRATASARCSASTPTASRTCSSWAATRRRSTST